MSRLLHNDIAGLDSQLLADRVGREIQAAKPQSGTTGKASLIESADAIINPPMAIPANGASAAPEAPANASAPTRESWLSRRFKATEQAIHLWLYRHKYLEEEVARIRAMVEEANGQLIALHTEQQRVARETREFAIALRDMSEKLAPLLNEIVPAHTKDITILKGDVLFQRRRLARLADGLPASATLATAPEASPEHPSKPWGGVDEMYVGFEERFRGPWQEIKERLRSHVVRLQARRPVASGKPLLDIGCGRGEWLELLGEAGIQAYGIDSNANAVAACERRGLPARHGDALAHLASLPDGALSALSAFHVIEHLPTEQLLRLLDEARRTLVPGGLLMLETPNPESIKVGATTFHSDPTHLRPIPPQLAEFLVDRCGFTGIEIVRLHPYPDSAFIREDTEAARRINELMYGPQDYAVIAQRA